MGLRSKIFRYAMSGGFTSSARISRAVKGIRPLGNIKLSKLFEDRSEQAFDEGMWEDYYYDIIEAQQDKAGNAGQETLLSDDYFGGDAKQYCRLYNSEYNPDEFVRYVKNNLGDDYYYAINEIIDECAEELFEAWDRSYSNDGIGDKLFGGGMFSGSNRVYGSFSNALANYTAAAAKRGYDLSGSAAGAKNNRELNRQALIKRFGSGPTKAWNTSNYYASASYVNAAKRNGKNI